MSQQTGHSHEAKEVRQNKQLGGQGRPGAETKKRKKKEVSSALQSAGPPEIPRHKSESYHVTTPVRKTITKTLTKRHRQIKFIFPFLMLQMEK